jgi:hypothetical protein
MHIQETAVQRIIHASHECSLIGTKKGASDATSSGRPILPIGWDFANISGISHKHSRIWR